MKSEREGTAATVVWRRSPNPSSTSESDGEATDELIVSEIRADQDTVFFDVAHKAAVPSREHDGAAAQLFVRRDGCAVVPPLVSGTVYRDWKDPSTLTVPLVELPDGELDLTLQALGQEDNWAFLKRGKSLRPLKLEERARYRFKPADPANGLPAAVGLLHVDCPDERVP